MSDETVVVINECYGGFSVSEAGAMYLREAGVEVNEYGHVDLPRDDPRLVAMVRQLGSKEASGPYGFLALVTIPADTDWYVHEYDGFETVREGRVWTSEGLSDYR